MNRYVYGEGAMGWEPEPNLSHVQRVRNEVTKALHGEQADLALVAQFLDEVSVHGYLPERAEAGLEAARTLLEVEKAKALSWRTELRICDALREQAVEELEAAQQALRRTEQALLGATAFKGLAAYTAGTELQKEIHARAAALAGVGGDAPHSEQESEDGADTVGSESSGGDAQ